MTKELLGISSEILVMIKPSTIECAAELKEHSNAKEEFLGLFYKN